MHQYAQQLGLSGGPLRDTSLLGTCAHRIQLDGLA